MNAVAFFAAASADNAFRYFGYTVKRVEYAIVLCSCASADPASLDRYKALPKIIDTGTAIPAATSDAAARYKDAGISSGVINGCIIYSIVTGTGMVLIRSGNNLAVCHGKYRIRARFLNDPNHRFRTAR